MVDFIKNRGNRPMAHLKNGEAILFMKMLTRAFTSGDIEVSIIKPHYDCILKLGTQRVKISVFRPAKGTEITLNKKNRITVKTVYGFTVEPLRYSRIFSTWIVPALSQNLDSEIMRLLWKFNSNFLYNLTVALLERNFDYDAKMEEFIIVVEIDFLKLGEKLVLKSIKLKGSLSEDEVEIDYADLYFIDLFMEFARSVNYSVSPDTAKELKGLINEWYNLIKTFFDLFKEELGTYFRDTLQDILQKPENL